MRTAFNLPIGSCIVALALLTSCSKQLLVEDVDKNLEVGKKLKETVYKIDDNPTWIEEFNQTDGLDTAVWSKIPPGTSFWDKHMSSDSACYAMRDGKLILRGIVNPNTTIDPRPYLTGGIQSKDKKDFGLGRIEIRAKFGSARGAWPALWMLQSTGKYPEGGEIDIMEHLNYDKAVYQTVHTPYTLDGNKNPKNSGLFPIADGYNTYAVEKHQDSIVFFVNNKRTFAYPRTATNKFPFADVNHYLLLDMQLGGDWPGTVDPATLPIEMEIDWVKFYPAKAIATDTTQSIISGATYQLVSATNNTSVLDVAASGTANGSKLILWNNYKSNNQKFIVTGVTGGYYKLQPAHTSGKVMDVANSATSDGTPVLLYNDNGTNNQKWKITAVGNGYYTLAPAHAPGSRLDTGAASNGQQIQISTANSNSKAQQWKFVKQ